MFATYPNLAKLEGNPINLRLPLAKTLAKNRKKSLLLIKKGQAGPPSIPKKPSLRIKKMAMRGTCTRPK
jgi:hypothetical protein